LISIKALHSGLCLGKGINNKAVQIECKDRLDLAVIEGFDKSITLMDFDSKLCLEVENGKKNNRQDLSFMPCNFNSQQRFSIGDLNSTNPMALRAKNSGKCVDVYGEDKSEGARIIQFKCHNGDNQLWDVII
jgi:cytochrome c